MSERCVAKNPNISEPEVHGERESERATLEMFNWLRSCKQQDMLEACKNIDRRTRNIAHASHKAIPDSNNNGGLTGWSGLAGWLAGRTAYKESRALSLNTKTI